MAPSKLEIIHYTPSSVRFIIGDAITTIPIVRRNQMPMRSTISARMSRTRMLTMYQVKIMPDIMVPHDEEIMHRIKAAIRNSNLLLRRPQYAEIRDA